MKPFTLFIKFGFLLIHLLSHLIHCLKQLANHSTEASQHSRNVTTFHQQHRCKLQQIIQ